MLTRNLLFTSFMRGQDHVLLLLAKGTIEKASRNGPGVKCVVSKVDRFRKGYMNM